MSSINSTIPQFSTRSAGSLESQLPSQAPEVSSTWRVTIGSKATLPKFNSQPLKNDGWKTTLLLGCYIFRGELLNFQGVLRNLAKIYIESWEPPKKTSHPIALVGCIEILIMASLYKETWPRYNHFYKSTNQGMADCILGPWKSFSKGSLW